MEALEEVLHEISNPAVYYKLSLFGVDLSITKAVVFLWISALLVFLLVWIPSRRAKMVPGGLQNLIESLLEFVRDGIVHEVMGEKGLKYFPFIATLFLYILVANLVGLVPGSYTATVQTGTTFSWALIVFIFYNYLGFRTHGFIGYLRSFIPGGVPMAMAPIMFILELISHIVRPFSLAVRLFANMLAGHMVIALFIGMSVAGAWYVKPLPFAFVIIMYLFEVFVAALQAYIYSILAAIYIGSALQSEH